jgi:hypothetical protein
VRELDPQAQHPRHHEQVRDVRIADDVQHALAQRHVDVHDADAAVRRAHRLRERQLPLQARDVHRPSVRTLDQLREVARDEVDDAELRRPRRPSPDTLSRTAFSAHWTFRPRCCAIDSESDAAKFSIFFPAAPFGASPLLSTGCAAPMFVPGAIAATWPASAMNTPADPAPAPLGATHTMTGAAR